MRTTTANATATTKTKTKTMTMTTGKTGSGFRTEARRRTSTMPRPRRTGSKESTRAIARRNSRRRCRGEQRSLVASLAKGPWTDGRLMGDPLREGRLVPRR